MIDSSTIRRDQRGAALPDGNSTKLHLIPRHPVAVAVQTVLMASAITLGTSTGVSAGSCTETGGAGSGVWTCSGSKGAGVTQSLSPSAEGNLVVQTEADFGIDVAAGDAIELTNTAGDSGITFSDNVGSMISGENDGIIVRNFSNGALSVTSSGTVVGTNGIGIGAYNYGSDITIFAVNATGSEYGIGAVNFGTGSLSVTSTGVVVGTSGLGIGAFNAGTDLTISAVDVSGQVYGIGAAHFGTGAVTVTATGNVSGASLDGIYAYSKEGKGTDITVSALNTVGNRNGIRVSNSGTGISKVTSTGNAVGTTSAGIYVSNSVAGTDLIISTVNASGATSGIHAINHGTGLQSITVKGVVTGGDDFAIKTETLANATTVISLEKGAHVSSTSGLGIQNNHGHSITTVNTGASVSGEIRLGGGSDSLTFAGGDFSGVTIFDGSDDSGVADGFDNILTFSGSSGQLKGSSVLNWQRVLVSHGSKISFSDSSLVTGTLETMNGGVLDGAGNQFQLFGNFSNGGTLAMQNGSTSDHFTVFGGYAGSGTLQLDVDFATSKSDQLIVNGDIGSGTTLINVANATIGNATGNDVVLVKVSGITKAGDFALLGGPITSGIFDYDLAKTDRHWVLAGAVNGTGAVYEALPLILDGFNRLPDFNQRRQLRSSTESHPIWLRFSGHALDATPDSSTSGLNFDRKQKSLQAGLDFSIESGPTSGWILGATLQHGQINADVTNTIGTGSIKTTGFGVGSTVTFLADSGFYADLQGQLNWLGSDIGSSSVASLVKSHNSKAYSLSLEMGQSFSVSSAGSLVPQVQLTWGLVEGDSFTDLAGNAIVPGANESAVLRLGFTYNALLTQNGQYYLLSNVLRDFSGEQKTTAAGTVLTSNISNTMGELGIGGELHLSPAQKLAGEVRYQGSLDGSGNKGHAFSVRYFVRF